MSGWESKPEWALSSEVDRSQAVKGVDLQKQFSPCRCGMRLDAGAGDDGSSDSGGRRWTKEAPLTLDRCRCPRLSAMAAAAVENPRVSYHSKESTV